MSLDSRFRDYLLTRCTLHIVRSSSSNVRFRPWWRKYWQVASLGGERSRVGHYWVYGIRTLPHESKGQPSDVWMSAACGKVITALCVAVDNKTPPKRSDAVTQFCFITPGGASAFSGPMPAFSDALKYFPDYGVAVSHPQQTIFGDTHEP